MRRNFILYRFHYTDVIFIITAYKRAKRPAEADGWVDLPKSLYRPKRRYYVRGASRAV